MDALTIVKIIGILIIAAPVISMLDAMSKSAAKARKERERERRRAEADERRERDRAERLYRQAIRDAERARRQAEQDERRRDREQLQIAREYKLISNLILQSDKLTNQIRASERKGDGLADALKHKQDAINAEIEVRQRKLREI